MLGISSGIDLENMLNKPVREIKVPYDFNDMGTLTNKRNYHANRNRLIDRACRQLC